MNVFSRSRAGTIGAIGEARVTEEQIREARVAFARRNQAWEEIAPAERLVRRGIGWLVDAETDFIWRVKGGEVFGRGSAQALTPGLPLTFFVNPGGDVVFVERVGRKTWSQVCEQRERSARGT